MDKMEQLEDCIKVQSSNGNWNYCPYMHGMANGLICAKAVLTGKDPTYLIAPESWLCDSPDIKRPVEATNVQAGCDETTGVAEIIE